MPVSSSVLRVGVVGAGYFGRYHCRILSELQSELQKVALTAISDLNAARAEEVARDLPCKNLLPKIFSHYESMLSIVDAVVIAAPTEAHKDIAIGCLRAGKHVFIEKPVTAALLDADELIEESDRRNLVVQVGHIERYNPGFIGLAGKVNFPTHVETERFSPLLERALDTDVTMDLMIHDIDIVLCLMGSQPVKVQAAGASVVSGKIDVAKAWLGFANGATALLSAGRLSGERIRLLKVSQADALYHLDYQSRVLLKYTRNGLSLKSEAITADDSNPLREEIRDFVASATNGKRPRVTALEGKNALKLAMEIAGLIRENKNYTSVMI